MATIINSAQAAALCKAWSAQHKAFHVVNLKKDGTLRTWNVNPKAGRSRIKGTGKPLPLNSDMIHVWDDRCSKPRDSKGRFMPLPPDADGWRTLNTATIRELRRGKEVYLVA